MGIVKKNAILMIDFALDAERTQKLSPEQAIYQACIIRFRPIMMTTMAALLGAMPLALGFGTRLGTTAPAGHSCCGRAGCLTDSHALHNPSYLSRF